MLEAARDIIQNRAVIADDWQVLRLDEGDNAETITVPAGCIIVPLTVWQAQRDTLQARADIGVWLASDARPEALKDALDHFKLIAIDFPRFVDGRGYSIAYNLRARLGYQGQLRAIGDVLRDQMFYMQRVGFDAFAPRADRDIHEALKGLTDFSESYQQSLDQKSPLFRRVTRDRPQEQRLPFGDGLGI
jgi:uncharacterized protein (DUF934 family)